MSSAEGNQAGAGASAAAVVRTRPETSLLESRAVAVALLVAALAPMAAALLALRQGWQPTGDTALIGLRSRDAWTSDAPLLGQPTTGDEYAGVESFHPGPIEYWAMGPLVRLLGPAGMVVVAAVLNGAALAGAVWCAARRGGAVLATVVAAFLALLVRALGASSLFDPFNSELATFPMVLAVLAAWSVLARDWWGVPLLAAGATLAAQVHVAAAAFVAVPFAIAAVSLVRTWVRHPGRLRRGRTPLVLAAAVLVVGWAPVLAHELSSEPSNLRALVETARAPHLTIGLSFVLERVATAVAPIPIFVRSTGRFGFLEDVRAAQVFAAALVLGGSAALAVFTRRARRRRVPSLLVGLVLASTAASVLVAAGTPPVTAFRADGTRWLWVIALLSWASLLWGAWHVPAAATRDRLRRPAVLAASGLGLVALGAALFGLDVRSSRDGAVMTATAAVSDQTIAAIPEGTYRLTFDGAQALVAIGPGLALRLEGSGRSVVVDEGPFTRGYGPRRAGPDVPVDGRLRISAEAGAEAQEGEEQVAEAPFPDGSGRGTVRVFLR